MTGNLVGPRPPASAYYLASGTTKELIGVKSAQLLEYDSGGSTGGSGTLTQSIFDTTSRADSAHIKFQNLTGSQKIIYACAIKALGVWRYSGSNGYIHDKYIDYEAIARDGDLKYELGNNMICDITQVNKLADISWKRYRVKKHIYTITMAGMLTYFEPGDWYTLQVGSVGHPEYINSLVEIYTVRHTLTAGDIGRTEISFREIMQNWVFDSTETARMIASGGFSRSPAQGGKVLVVAASTYLEMGANFYCDGTDDQVEINNAIMILSQNGGGKVMLSEGTFNISSYIEMLSNITLEGTGPGTIINSSSPTYSIYAEGTAISHRLNITIQSIQLIGDHASGDATIYMRYVDNLVFINNLIKKISDAYVLYHYVGSNNNIANNIFDGGGTGDNYVIILCNVITQTLIVSNVLKSYRGTSISLYGIDISNTDGSIVANNQLYDFSTSSGNTYGIIITGNYNTCSTNRIEQMKNSATAANVKGIYIAGGTSNCLSSNLCYNNGTDTGIGNTHGCNFYDGGTDTQYAG